MNLFELILNLKLIFSYFKTIELMIVSKDRFIQLILNYLPICMIFEKSSLSRQE